MNIVIKNWLRRTGAWVPGLLKRQEHTVKQRDAILRLLVRDNMHDLVPAVLIFKWRPAAAHAPL